MILRIFIFIKLTLRFCPDTILKEISQLMRRYYSLSLWKEFSQLLFSGNQYLKMIIKRYNISYYIKRFRRLEWVSLCRRMIASKGNRA